MDDDPQSSAREPSTTALGPSGSTLDELTAYERKVVRHIGRRRVALLALALAAVAAAAVFGVPACAERRVEKRRAFLMHFADVAERLSCCEDEQLLACRSNVDTLVEMRAEASGAATVERLLARLRAVVSIEESSVPPPDLDRVVETCRTAAAKAHVPYVETDPLRVQRDLASTLRSLKAGQRTALDEMTARLRSAEGGQVLGALAVLAEMQIECTRERDGRSSPGGAERSADPEACLRLVEELVPVAAAATTAHRADVEAALHFPPNDRRFGAAAGRVRFGGLFAVGVAPRPGDAHDVLVPALLSTSRNANVGDEEIVAAAALARIARHDVDVARELDEATGAPKEGEALAAVALLEALAEAPGHHDDACRRLADAAASGVQTASFRAGLALRALAARREPCAAAVPVLDERLARTEGYERGWIIEALGRCGPAALPVLHALEADPAGAARNPNLAAAVEEASRAR